MSGGGNVDSGGWTNLRFPNAFAHPFEFQGRDGKVRKRMLVTIPKGVVLADGRDLAYLSEKLGTIDCAAPVDAAPGAYVKAPAGQKAGV